MKTSYFLLSQKFLSFKQMVPGIFQIIHGSVPFMTVLLRQLESNLNTIIWTLLQPGLTKSAQLEQFSVVHAQ